MNLRSELRAVVSARGPARVVTVLLPFAFSVIFPLLAQPLPQAPAGLTAREIVSRAVEQAKWARERGYEDRLQGEHISVREDLTDDKGVRYREEILYRVYPVDGHLYYERMAVNGEPLSEDERRQRKEDFSKEIAEQEAKGEEEDDGEIKFDEELISRYDSELAREVVIGGRDAYLIEFEPKTGKLPVRRRIDHALNNSRGRIWIDKQDYGVARVQFELIKPVTLWAGLLGKVGAVEGDFQQVRLADGVWVPENLRLYMKGRVLFKSFHQRRTLQWQSLQLAPAELALTR